MAGAAALIAQDVSVVVFYMKEAFLLDPICHLPEHWFTARRGAATCHRRGADPDPYGSLATISLTAVTIEGSLQTTLMSFLVSRFYTH